MNSELKRTNQQMTLVLVLLVSASLAQASSPSSPKEMGIEAADGATLKGTYFEAAKPGPAVVFFHQCSRERTVWIPLATTLVNNGFHVLVVNPRGIGDSGGEKWDYDGSLEHALTYWREKWGDDADVAYRWLLAQPGVDKTNITAAGAGCGAFLALLTAQKHHPNVRSLVQLSGFEDRSSRSFVEHSPNLAIFNAAASPDSMSADAGQSLKRVSRNPANRFLVYPERGHGIGLIEAHPELTANIVDWLKAQTAQHKP